MDKQCVKCAAFYPEECYTWNKSGLTRMSSCPNCVAAYNRDRAAAHRRKKRGPDWQPKYHPQQACTPEGHSCRSCNEPKACTEYFFNNTFKYGHESTCKQCKAEKRRAKVVTPISSELAKYRFNRDQIAAWKRNYNITEQQYRNLLQDQFDSCAMCLGQEKNGKALAVDHDHTCCPGERSCGVCVRGLLCSDCNRLLGKLESKPHALEFLGISEHPYLRRRLATVPWMWTSQKAYEEGKPSLYTQELT